MLLNCKGIVVLMLLCEFSEIDIVAFNRDIRIKRASVRVVSLSRPVNNISTDTAHKVTVLENLRSAKATAQKLQEYQERKHRFVFYHHDEFASRANM
jgi:hypothetical protein